MAVPAVLRSRRFDGYRRSALVLAFGLLVAGTGFAGGIVAQREVFDQGRAERGASASGSDDAIADSTTPGIAEVQRLIEEEYYYRPDSPLERAAFARRLAYNALQGMTEGLDEHTAFLIPAEHDRASDPLSGDYEGIGIWVDFPDGAFTIVAPMPGSPAEAAGLRAGDVVIAVDGRPLAGVAEAEALNLVQGPVDSTVRLTVKRPNVEESLTVDVVRRDVVIPTVAYRLLAGDDVAHLKVALFNDQTTEQLDQAVAQAKEDGVAGIVLDLRNNGGGWIAAAQELIGRFVPSERGVAFYEDSVDGEGGMEGQPIVGGAEPPVELPLVVLVNHGTASAAEIVAGALRHYGRATVVGEPTFGKGSVQRIHEFADGSAMRITRAMWLTPAEQSIEGTGIEPDIVVEQDAWSEIDVQLERAVAEMHNRR